MVVCTFDGTGNIPTATGLASAEDKSPAFIAVRSFMLKWLVEYDNRGLMLSLGFVEDFF